MALAVRLYDAVVALHIAAVVVGFGLPMAYPSMLAYFRQADPRSMPTVHRVQARLGDTVIPPLYVLVLVLGIYLTTDAGLWGEVWITVPLVLLIVMGAIGALVLGPSHERLAGLAAADVRAAGPGGAVEWSAEYERTYRRMLRFEFLFIALVLVAILFMVAKPFA
jgi:uncharacterized membrane protein